MGGALLATLSSSPVNGLIGLEFKVDNLPTFLIGYSKLMEHLLIERYGLKYTVL